YLHRSTSPLPFALCPLPFDLELHHRAAAVRLELRLEGFFADRTNQWLVLGGDDHDARVRDGVTTGIFFGVESDERAARDEHVAIDDRAANARVPSHPHTRLQDGLFDITEAVDAYVWAEN